MNVEESTRRDSRQPDQTSSRQGGSHRAARRGPNPLLLLSLAVLVVVIGGFFLVRALLGGDDGASQPQDDPASRSSAPAQAGDAQSGAEQGGAAQDADSIDGELASDPASVSAGSSLAANERLALDPAERTELEEGRVDIRVLSLLALLSADYSLDIGDFAAPQAGAGSGLAYVVDITAVDGDRVGARAGRELVRTARDQLGVYKPQSVTLVDGSIRIAFAPRDSDQLPPIPIP